MDNNETRCKLHLFLFVPFLILFYLLLFFADVFPNVQNMVVHFKGPPIEEAVPVDQTSLDGFLVKTNGCRIPDMDAFDVKIMEFYQKETKPVCNDGKPALVDFNLTSIFIVNSSLAEYGVSQVSCCYKSVKRKKPTSLQSDDKFVFSPNCIGFTSSARIYDEFIEVFCYNSGKLIYKDLFYFVPIKKHLLKYRRRRNRPFLNVLIVGLDAVSRLNLYRQMPKTVEFLHNISAIELLGYNKVADNTFPNLIPVLAGKTEEELKNKCWRDDGHFDSCRFVWKLYKSRGYVTSFGEDSSWMGIFNYQRKGFIEQPTDYAYTYFNRIAEREIGNQHKLNVDRCIGPREVYISLLDYITKFSQTMHREDLPYFGFYWGASLSHDYLNAPSLGDENYYNFFMNFYENGYLTNTALIFMSDHGIRWGDIRQTYQGRMEERLPFVYILLPEWYRKRYPEVNRNLIRNTRRLTSNFDLYETLLDLAKPFNLTDSYLQKRNAKFSRGYSLFGNIRPERTCEEAAIETHWCTCQHSFEVDTNSSFVIEASSFVVDYINSLLAGYGQCANLSLDAIINARLMSHADQISESDNKIQDYMITLRTVPGDGIFEATVRENCGTKSNEVVGTVSRLNLYGKQSGCISDFHLKLYCYCKSLLQ